MNRLYVIESTPSSTGAKADHRFPAKASEFANIFMNDSLWPDPAFTRSLSSDLHSHSGSSVVIVGDHLPPQMHAFGA